MTETVFDPHYLRRDHVIRLAEAVGLRAAACYGNRLAYALHLVKPLA